MVRHIIPTTLKEALTYLNEGTFQILAGGTDLMIQKRSSAGTPPHFERDLIYLANLPELKYITFKKKVLSIGAMTTLEDILDHPNTPLLLKKVIQEIGSPSIRHVGTLAGNIGNASPAGDSLVALYLLDAKVKLTSLQSERIIPIEELITGVRKTIIKPNELIKEIIIEETSFDGVYWNKVSGRQANAISKISFAGAYRLEKNKVIDIRLVFGSIAITVIRSRAIENTLKNLSVSQLKVELSSILEKYSALMAPIDDQRSTKLYRKEVALNIAKQFIDNIGK